MGAGLKSRIYALELLTTQVISEYLRSVPDPAAQAQWAKQHLHALADALRVEANGFDDEARLRVGIKADISRIIDDVAARAQTIPLRQPSYDVPPGG
jgi:hypothetical protein